MDDNSVFKQLLFSETYEISNKQNQTDYLNPLKYLYSDKFYFIVELIKNSVEALSSKVKITLSKQDQTNTTYNLYMLSVRDFGNGFNQTTLTKKLLSFPYKTHFSELKGIGFATVLTQSNLLIHIKTTHLAKTLEVFIDSDGNYLFQNTKQNFDGTIVDVFFEDKTSENKIKQQIFSVLKKYCKHSEIPIIWDNKNITEKFHIYNSFFETSFNESNGDKIAIGYTYNNAFYSLYKNGFLLFEIPSPFPYISIKFDSPYLNGFSNISAKFSIIIEKYSRKYIKQLKKAYFDKMEKFAFELSDDPEYTKLLAGLPYVFHTLNSNKYLNKNILPSISKHPESLNNFFKAKTILITKKSGRLAQYAQKNGYFVVSSKISEETLLGLRGFLKSKNEPYFEILEQKYGYFEILNFSRDSVEDKFITEIKNMAVNIRNFRLKNIQIGNFISEQSHNYPFLPLTSDFIMDIEEFTGKFSENSTLILIYQNPFIQKLISISGKYPKISAYLLIRAFWLFTDKNIIDSDFYDLF